MDKNQVVNSRNQFTRLTPLLLYQFVPHGDKIDCSLLIQPGLQDQLTAIGNPQGIPMHGYNHFIQVQINSFFFNNK